MNVLTQPSDWEQIWNTAYAKESVHAPFFTYQWHTLWQKTFAAGSRMIVFAHNDNSTIIPLILSPDGTAHFTGGEEIADYLDAIGDNALKPDLWKETLSYLKTHNIHSLTLRNIPHTSETLTFFKTVNNARIDQEDTTPILALPKTLPEYLGNLDRKDRHEYKRKIRKFEEAYPGATVNVHTCTPEDMATLLSLMKGREDKTEFLTPQMEQFFRSLPLTFPETLITATLTHMQTPIATLVAFEEPRDKCLLLYNSGYRNDFVGSGFYLKAKMIEWAIGSLHTCYNFLQGNERYKYELGGIDQPVHRVTITL